MDVRDGYALARQLCSGLGVFAEPPAPLRMRVHHSSEKQDWRTPSDFLDLVRRVGPIGLDPCASDDPEHHFARFNITKDQDGLVQPWHKTKDFGLTYVNSEYGRALPRWVDKCATQAELGCEIIQLMPARPGSGWYRAAQAAASAMCELSGRLTFVGAKDPAPFPSAVFYYGPNPYLFCHVFQGRGGVRTL